MMTKLSPCPICRGKALWAICLIKNVKHYYIKCTNCGISTQVLKDKEYIKFLWENVPV